MSKTAKSRKPEDTFESRLKSLEELVDQLESGELPLEQAVKTFEEGMKLSKQLNEALAAVEQKIETLLVREGGEVSIKPFDPEPDEGEE